MTTPVFPVLAGQGWSVKKKPAFATLVASHVSAREVRSPRYVNPIWNFELTFDGLDGGSAYSGLGANSLQSLLGLFLQCQGQYGAFLYYDPTDYSVSAQAFGTGDGVTTSFQLVRSLGGFVEPVIAPFVPSAPTLFQVQGSAAGFAPNNIINQTGNFSAANWTKSNCSITASGVSDPFGGTAAQTLTASAGNANLIQNSAAAGANYVNSTWLRRNAGSGAVYIVYPSGSAGPGLSLTSSWQRFWLAGAPSGGLAHFTLHMATGGDAVDVCGPEIEQSLLSTPGPYFQTLASDYFGGPWITAAGALVDPSAYTIANGVVTFSVAPSVGAALAWTGYFGFLCRFDGDDLDFEQFMANLWAAKSVKFRSLRAQ